MKSLAFLLIAASTALAAQGQPESPPGAMKILVHISHGTEAPTRAALGFHVAKAAVDEGHEVTVFLAGDGVTLLRAGTIDQMVGLGTGKLQDLYVSLVDAGVPFYLSGGSSNARSLSKDDLALDVTFASPQDLVRLAVEHDRMFTY